MITKLAVLFKISRGLLVLMLCLTLGFQWGLLQSVAWAGMLVNYSRHDSLRDAMVKTFDGQHPCPLCKLVSEGKKSEKKPEAQQDGKKLDLFAAGGGLFDFSPRTRDLFPDSFSASARPHVPPLPPPRSFLG